jgi:23S rRNA pseudouridine2605 synthase
VIAVPAKLGKVALERALSKMGLASRTQTRRLILEGKLRVNGKIIKDPLYPVVPEKDKFVLDGLPVRRGSLQTIMLYKPKSVVTTRCDERGRAVVFDLLPEELKHLHAVGRLDMATTGLLLFTNDTRLSAYLTDPVNAVPRVYVVVVRGKITQEKLRQAVLKPAKITLRKASNKESHLVVELTEGKNREIRRLFESIGHEVTRLKRVAFGCLKLEGLQPGQFRYLTPEEAAALKKIKQEVKNER